MFQIKPTARLRPSPYFESVVAEGMVSAMVYNRMILPTGFGDPEAEYWRIINGVSMWDVGCERQVELLGPDAGELVRILSPRHVMNMTTGQGKYVPLCNHDGVLINDPILLKIEEDRYWFSIADSDIWFWARAIAAERGLNVQVNEPDVSPLAVQGPRAEDVIASLFGEWVRSLRYFWFRDTEIEGIPVLVARSGWSKQGGFEIYLRDGSRGSALWNLVKEAGQPFGIGPGAPATAERTESGLISWGGDTDDQTNPFEVRLGKYVDLDVGDDVIGIQALRTIAERGPSRHQLGVVLEGSSPDPSKFNWDPILKAGRRVGSMTNCSWSLRMERNIGYALVAIDVLPGETVTIERPGGNVTGTLTELPFL